MPTQKESHAKRQAPPLPVGARNETNPISARPTTQIRETNPISPAAGLWKTKKYETNPIYRAGHDPKIRNKPNLPSRHPATTPKNETNPIYPYPSLPNNQKIRNEPNLPHHHRPAAPYFSETNPIATAADLWRTKKCETNPIYEPPTTNYELFMRNKPNPRLEPPNPQSTIPPRRAS